MSEIRPKEIAGAILAFEEQYNEKLAALFSSCRDEKPSLTRSQVKTLFLLFMRSEQTATELGDAMRMTKANLTGILDALEAEGLVCRTVDPADRRRVLVSLTGAGRKICERKAREMDAKLEARFEPLSQADRAEFVRCLHSAAALLKKLED